MKIKLMIDEVGYQHKPTKIDIPQIQIRLRNPKTIKYVSPEELMYDYIGKGNTILPAIMSNGTRNDDWIEQQLIGIDVDNKDKIITPEEAITILEKKNIHVMGYYHTFSSTSKVPRYRLLFLLPTPCTDRNKIEFIIKTLNSFIGGDEACKNVSRLFFGTDGQTKKVIVVNPDATITLEDVIKLIEIPSVNNYNKNNDLMQLINSFDFAEYVHRENTPDHVSGNIEYYQKCPICGHNDCFRLYLDTNTFFCFGSNGCKGGTIIDYLMATKNMNLADAIKYFKYDILKMPNNFNDNANAVLDNIKEQIKINIRRLGFAAPADINWIYYSEKGLRLSCPRLAQSISENIPYIFAKSKTKSGMVKYFYINNNYKMLDDKEILGLIKQFVEPLELHKTSIFNEVLNLLMIETSHHKMLEEMNSDESIINFKNGILNIKSGKILPHSPKYLTSIQIPCNYVENCPSPDSKYFDNFINDFTDGNEEVKKLLLQGMGVSLSNIPGYRLKQAFFCIGLGNSGKSQIKLLLTNLLGTENCTSVDLKDLEKPFHAIELLNKRLAGSNDMSGMKINSLEKFKQLTGGDYITDSYKNEGLIDFRFNGVIWMLGNQMPVFGGDRGDHIYDRMIIIDCNNVIPEEKRDKHLLEHLLEEKEYIVSLAIKGLKEVIANDYKYDIPEICKQRNQLYRVENDSFLSFMKECVIDRPKGEPIKDKITIKVFFNAYREWCKVNNNNYFQPKSEVKKILTQMGKGQQIHTNGGYDYFEDITLTVNAIKEYTDLFKGENVEDPEIDTGMTEQEELYDLFQDY